MNKIKKATKLKTGLQQMKIERKRSFSNILTLKFLIFRKATEEFRTNWLFDDYLFIQKMIFLRNRLQ